MACATRLIVARSLSDMMLRDGVGGQKGVKHAGKVGVDRDNMSGKRWRREGSSKTVGVRGDEFETEGKRGGKTRGVI